MLWAGDLPTAVPDSPRRRRQLPSQLAGTSRTVASRKRTAALRQSISHWMICVAGVHVADRNGSRVFAAATLLCQGHSAASARVGSLGCAARSKIFRYTAQVAQQRQGEAPSRAAMTLSLKLALTASSDDLDWWRRCSLKRMRTRSKTSSFVLSSATPSGAASTGSLGVAEGCETHAVNA